MNVLSPDKRDRAAAACLYLPIFCFLTPIARAVAAGIGAGRAAAGLKYRNPAFART
jgi:hypothetical protein